MKLKNKIVAGALCAIIAGIGILGTVNNTARAQTAATTSSGLSIDQLQQIVNGLKQQIELILQLLSQRNNSSTNAISAGSRGCAKEGTACWATKCASNGNSYEVAKCGEGGSTCCAGLSCVNGKCTGIPANIIATHNVLPCANENEIFSGNAKQCCNGLTKITSNSQPSCQVGAECNNAANYTCANISLPTTAQCAEKCKTMGYGTSNCKTYGGLVDPKGKETMMLKCGFDYIDAGTTNDCNGAGIVDGSQTCCCKKLLPVENCVKEGKIIDWRISPVEKCCSGLTQILDCKSSACPKNSNSICTYCGNGACGLGENKFNCPADCKTTADNCVIGIKTDSCCACPKKITANQLGSNNWVKYESGKDYSDYPKNENCSNIACGPCLANLTCD
ncbi:MAG: hypothetical protein WCX69_01935 [Candidatus Paceibacterota bacterium]